MGAPPPNPRDLPLLLTRMDAFCFTRNGSCRTIVLLARRIGLSRDGTRAPMQVRNGWRPSGRRSDQPAAPSKNGRFFVQPMGSTSLFTRPEGWLGVPDAFLRLYSKLKPYALTVGEAMFVLELMVYKWSVNAPFPSYKSLGKRMGVSDKMVRRYAANLEGKNYLRREARIGSTNAFDLSPLFAALAAALEEEKKLTRVA